ncbi:hypothetical protein [Shimazuella kribbensis]|uniref:hypothetical protein n=1 Tax=Shimazuella kribbensis TaxID=139808 RepID=UPI00041D26E1|nr:hypothetical protein [Shimazuella kribbensis]
MILHLELADTMENNSSLKNKVNETALETIKNSNWYRKMDELKKIFNFIYMENTQLILLDAETFALGSR